MKIKRITTVSLFLAFLILTVNSTLMAQKYVGIFYSCWANECLNTTYGDDVYITGTTPYSPYPQWNWWGKPLYAATHGDGTIKNNYKMYFDTPENPNNGLIDWHAELLYDAGVDFITLDLTNGTQTKIVDGAKAICKRYEERYNQGLNSPKIVFWVQDSVCLQKVETEIFNISQDDIFFEYLGKKLVNVAGGNVQPAIPEEGIFSKYTCRRMWGLDNSGKFWQFKVNSETPPPPFYYNGEPEQMCAPVATQATYMTTDGVNPAPGAVGRQNGVYFVKYMDAAIAKDVKFVFIHSWNEWTAQNLGTNLIPTFVDQWTPEYSSDIEPVYGEHGWQYYDLMREKIAEFKGISSSENNTGATSSYIYKVQQNFPNPFNPQTSISYELKNNSHVLLEVFNSLGEKIATLVDEEKSKGKHIAVFNGANLVTGIYLYRLVVSDETGTYLLSRSNKMLLLK